MDACDGLAFARLQTGDAEGAAAMFEQALSRFPQHARSLIGLADAARHADHPARANDLFVRAEQAIEELKRGGRPIESAMARAYAHVADGRPADAIGVLTRLLDQAPPGSAGWTLPVEPWFGPLRQTPDGRAILAKLASRAR